MIKLILQLLIPIVVINILGAPLQLSAQSFSQKENNVWVNWDRPYIPDNIIYAGFGIGMDFNAAPPATIVTSGPFSSSVSSASICDKNGTLLFYTDGNVVWNRNHDVMNHGWDINNDGNCGPHLLNVYGYPGTAESGYSYDGTVICPMPGSSHKYYIFSICDTFGILPSGVYSSDYFEGKLRYSIVDMELDGGLGDVDTNYKARFIADSMAGVLQIVKGDNCNLWLLAHAQNGTYHSFNITADGVDSIPVVSVVTTPLDIIDRELNVSPDRTKVTLALINSVQVSNFNPGTGVVSDMNPPVFLGAQQCNTTAFSPNSSKLYLSGIIGIRQYDLSVSPWTFNLLPVNQNEWEFDNPMRLGPDGKIYFTYTNGSYDGVRGGIIAQPDLAGVACQMDTVSNAPYMLRRAAFDQLPNEVAVIVYDTTTRTIKAPICFNDSSVLLQPLSAPDTGTDYHWKFKNGVNYVAIGTDTAALKVTLPGIYTVQYFTAAPCAFHQDTFWVDHVNFSLSLLRNDPQLASCDGQPITLDPYTDAKNPVYLWQDSSTAATLAANASGQYKVSISSEGCTATDSIHVFITDVRQSLRDDTVLCAEKPEQSVLLQASVPQGAAVLWSTGSTDAAIYVADSGWYAVTVTDSGCVGTDSFHLDREFCECPVLFPTAFSPNSDGRNDHYRPAIPGNCSITAYKMEMYNRWGQRVYVGYDGDKGWDGSYNGQPADVGIYMYRLQMTVGLEKETIIKNGDFVLLR